MLWKKEEVDLERVDFYDGFARAMDDAALLLGFQPKQCVGIVPSLTTNFVLHLMYVSTDEGEQLKVKKATAVSQHELVSIVREFTGVEDPLVFVCEQEVGTPTEGIIPAGQGSRECFLADAATLKRRLLRGKYVTVLYDTRY